MTMISLEQARKIFERIDQSRLVGLRRQMFQKAWDYAQVRSGWYFLEPEERLAMDQRRTLAHEAFIDSVNILSRNMLKDGEDNSWREALGDDRKLIGDFACYVHLFLGLRNR